MLKRKRNTGTTYQAEQQNTTPYNAHDNMLHFLICQKILKEIRSLTGTELDPRSKLNSYYLQHSPSILQLISDEITSKDIEALEQLILSTRKDTRSGKKSALAIAAANAATIYVRTRHTQIIGSKDWSQTQIVGADISGANFYDMDFTGSHWSNVTANSITMNSCECDGMELTGIELGESKKVIGQSLDKGHTNIITSMTASGDLIFSGSRDTTIRIWDINTGKCIQVINEYNHDITSMHTYGPYLLSTSGFPFSDKTTHTIKARGINNNEQFELNKEHNHDHSVISIFTNSSYIFSGSEDTTIKIWDIATGEIVKELTGHKSAVTSVYANETHVFSGSRDKTVRIWNIATGDFLELKGHEKWIESVYANSSLLFSGGHEKTIKIWDIATGSPLKTLEGHKKKVVTICANESHIFSGSYDNTVRVWDINTGKCIKILTAHNNLVMKLHLSRDTLVSVDLDGIIIKWNITNINDIKLSKAIGKQIWEQALRLVDNTAKNIFGLSASNQEPFKASSFEAEFNASRPLICDPIAENTSPASEEIASTTNPLGVYSEANAVLSSSLRPAAAASNLQAEERTTEDLENVASNSYS